MVSLSAIREAAQILQGRIIRTPLVFSPTFSEMTDTGVYLKLECMQKAGSFKVRGATNRILSDLEAIGKNGVIAASAGNHAQGVAVAACGAGVAATIVMPEWVSPSKQEATAGYGAKIVLKGRSLQESIDHASELAASQEMTFIHPYNDESVIAGQGTVGLEILEELPGVDCVIVPVGGGGLIAGIATVIKELSPDTRVIGVQSETCESAAAAIRHGSPITVESDPTIAEGIRVTRVGDIAFPVIRDRVDEVVSVSDRDIVRAITLLLERKKVLAEGAGAASLAALIAGKVAVDTGEKVAAVISGGNVDAFLFERILRLGLFDSGRILQCTVELEEGPRSFPALFSLVTWEGGVITRIEQERASPDLPLYLVRVTLEMEVRSRDHRQRMLTALRDAGYTVTALNPPEDLSHGFYHSMERG
jgi:threonine dehydratase